MSGVSKPLFLYFPQWQGSSETDEIRQSAEHVFRLLDSVPFKKVPLSSAAASSEYGILSFQAILEQLRAAKKLIAESRPDRIFTLGGDCGVEVAPVSYLNLVHQGNLGVLWLDAHGDLNTPASSPSKLFHGMPLRALLGEGDRRICEELFSTLDPNQIALIGARDLDGPEREFIAANSVQCFPAVDPKRVIAALKSHFLGSGLRKIYIHLDCDVIDPKDFPHVKCPTEGGIPFQILLELLSAFRDDFEIAGISLLEHCLSVTDPPASLRQTLELWSALTTPRSET
jgi:arginase